MQILKDEAKLSLRFAPEEVMRRFGATQGSAKGFQVETWAAQFLKGLKLFQLWNRGAQGFEEDALGSLCVQFMG